MEHMNDNEQILTELRRIGAWADMQRKATKRAFIIMAVFVPAMIALGIVGAKLKTASIDDAESSRKPDKPTWTDVDRKILRADLDEAIRIGEELIQKTPQYSEGHHRLASAYLAAGKTEQARRHYAQAFHLLPSEENEKLLISIDKRIKDENLQPSGVEKPATKPNDEKPVKDQTSTQPSKDGPR